jgi:Tat protein translocase TatB subunit
MEFFGIGLPELVVILVLTLIVVGPQRLPEVAAQIGRTIREFRRYSSGVTKELLDAVQDLEREYKDLRGELTSVSGELRDKAEAFGRELTGVADDVRDTLQVEGPSPKPATEVAPSGDNGSSGVEVPAPPALPAMTEESVE